MDERPIQTFIFDDEDHEQLAWFKAPIWIPVGAEILLRDGEHRYEVKSIQLEVDSGDGDGPDFGIVAIRVTAKHPTELWGTKE
jgi:hypothetical protein